MIRVHFLINKLNIKHIIALGGKKAMKNWEKRGIDVKMRQIPLLGTYA